MPKSSITFAGYDRIKEKLERITHIPRHATIALMEDFEEILHEDNRRAALAGLDKNGNPLLPAKYRINIGRKTYARRGAAFGGASGTFKGFNLVTALPHNNLSTREYKLLTGPPLAPRGTESRIITNLVTGYQEISPDRWEAISFWGDVLSAKGVPFLDAHFEGRGNLPVRDLRGVRPWGMRQARERVREWAKYVLAGA